MKWSVLLLAILLTSVTYAQKTFIVDDFSDRYFGKVFISDTGSVFSEGWVAIFDKKTKKQLIKIESSELSFSLREGEVIANIKELPYGEQSQIMFDDFNFDGKKDFALMDGQNSCYHGPSFQIYLANGRGFTHSRAFTRLAQDYCGMFDVDAAKKTISTMTKSGCCWHQSSSFVVTNNIPVPVKIIEEGRNANGLLIDFVEQNRVGGKMRKKEYSVFDRADLGNSVFFSFRFSNGKKMSLVDQSGLLYYVFTDKDDKVELLHSDSFTYSKRDELLTFKSGGVTYAVSKHGISVKSTRTNLDMKAEPTSIDGSLAQVETAKFENVIYK